jgi:hypothetical protein
MRLLRLALVAWLAAGLAACTTSLFGAYYDAELEQGLVDYNRSAMAFIKSMELNAANPEGRFDSPAATAFYAASAATLSDLQLRADVAGGPSECRLARLAGVITSVAERSIEEAEALVGAEGGAVEPIYGNCMSIVVRNVRIQHENLELDHRETGVLRGLAVDLNEHAIESAVRVALETVRAWRFE